MSKGVSHQLRLLTYSWQAVGPKTIVRDWLRWASDPEARCVDSGFDQRYGTDTNADLTPREAAIPDSHRRDATMYLPTMDQDLEAMLAALPWPNDLRHQASFVDLGSGKGRVVFLAAMRRFFEVVGVELSPVLHRVARANLEIMARGDALRTPVRLIQNDAAAFEPPDNPVVIYMYHPFRGEIAERAIARLVGSLVRLPRPAAILYGHPTLQPRLDDRMFTVGGVFDAAAEGARQTRHFRIGWTIFTNDRWYGDQACSAAS